MHESNLKVKNRFDVFVLVIFSYCILYPVLFLIANYYEDAVSVVLGNLPQEDFEPILNNQKFKTLFKFSKIGLFFILIWLAALWFDYFTAKNKKLTSFLINKVSNTLYVSFSNNKIFLASLTKEIRIAFLLIVTMFCIGQYLLLVNIPLSYDELFSYTFFSGKGLWTSLSYYPAPNNHVLYNIITSFFVKLPIDIEISIRIPALIASVFTVYYFFKLANSYFGGKIAVLISVFIICLYPFQLFSISARGYAFVNLFCVLLLYAISKLIENPVSKKYRWIFIISSFGGLFAVPSFLYVLFAVYGVYFIYLLFSKQKKAILNFIKDCIISGCLTVLGYFFIYIIDQKDSLTNPNGGATKFSLSDGGLLKIITDHIKYVSDYLFINSYTLFIVYLLVAICLLYLFIFKKARPSFITVLSFFMILSPIVILPLHRVLPFQRNWLYLTFPLAICLGFLLSTFSAISAGLFARFTKIDVVKNLFFVLFAIYMVSLAKFDVKHNFESRIDYEIDEIREKYINSEVRNIRSLGMTGKSMEYYPTEFINFLCLKYDPKRNVSIQVVDTITNQDILVIDNSEEERFKSQLDNYKVLSYFDEKLTVYYRNKP